MADGENIGCPIARYDAMCRAIAEAHAVDEVKDLRDKAAALQAYARMAGNFDAEKRCAEIRLRAERRAGELLAAMDKAKGGRPSKTPAATEGVSTLKDLGISEKQSSTWQRLAAVPRDRFETLLTRETTQLPPTAYSIIGENDRLTLEASVNERLNKLFAGLTPEEVKSKLSGRLPPGVEADFWKNVANRDSVTGTRLSDPKPSVAMLTEADQALGAFLERFNGPGFGEGSRVRRRIEEARGVINYMLANAHGRH